MEDVTGSMQRIAKYTEEIEKLHKQVLTAVNVNEAHRTYSSPIAHALIPPLGLSQAIEEFSTKVNDQANSVRLTLKGCSDENERLVGHITSSDMRIRRTQQAKQAKKFIELMKRFQDMQNQYKGKYRAQLERQYLIVKPMATREELDKIISVEGGDAMLSQQAQLFSMSNKAMAQTQLSEMKERHHEIVAIEKSIQEIHQMFLDMALIVDQQGELIDRIGEHVDNTLEFTQKAANQVESAVASKRRSQRIKWILTIVGIVILIIVFVTLGIELGLFKGNSNNTSHAPPPQNPTGQGQQPPPQQQPAPPQQPPPPQQQPPPPVQQQAPDNNAPPPQQQQQGEAQQQDQPSQGDGGNPPLNPKVRFRRTRK